MSRTSLSTYIWNIFWGYWILSAMYTRLRVKKVSSGQRNTQRIVHLSFVIIAFFITLFQFRHITFWNKSISDNLTVQYTGVVILITSLLFAVWARVTLGRNWSGAIQKVEGQRLVRSGPYKYIRNPIYTGIIFGFFGTFITFGTMASLVGFIIILLIYIIKINNEQKFLMKEFGEEYRKYIAESWALIPFIF